MKKAFMCLLMVATGYVALAHLELSYAVRIVVGSIWLVGAILLAWLPKEW